MPKAHRSGCSRCWPLGETGGHGLAAAERLRAGGGIPGSVVAAWLVEQNAVSPGAMTETEATLGITDHFAALHEQHGFLDEMQEHPIDHQISLVRMITVVDHPSKLDLLDAIAGEHPDRKVAKAARKARFRLRTAGTDA